MPQGAFRIGPLPKAGEPPRPAERVAPERVAPEHSAPAPAPARVIAAPRPQGVLAGGASPAFFGGGGLGGSPSPRPPAAPVAQAPVVEAPVVEAPPRLDSASVIELQTPAEPPPPAEARPMQVAEVEVIARPRTPPTDPDDFAQPAPQPDEVWVMPRGPAPSYGPRRSLMPLIAAGAVVVGGVAALAVVFATRHPAPPAPAAASPAPVIAAAPEATPASSPPVSTASPLQTAAETPASPTPPQPAPGLRAPAVKSAIRQAFAGGTARRPISAPPVESAPAAPPAAEAAPTLVVPRPAPVVAAPPPAPALAPHPPAPSDPAVPISTHPTTSE
jgi:hypothetical protein